MKTNDKLKKELEKKRDDLLKSLADGTFKVDTKELTQMSAPLAWFKKNKKLLQSLDKIAEYSGLLKKK